MALTDLIGRVAFVTGAARGIGRAVTLQLLDAGCTVVANVRELTSDARELVAECEAKAPDRLVVVEGSIDDSSVVSDAAKLIFQKYRRLDVVVNNAGIIRDAYIGMISDADIDAVLRTNLVGVIKVTQTMSRIMARQKSGSIINISSIIGRRGNAAQLLYSASKAGVIGATYAAAKELAPKGIRVNAVAPGLIDTAMIGQLAPETRDRLLSQVGMGRLGTAQDVAKAVLFLASDLSDYVTGQVLGVDGGLIL